MTGGCGAAPGAGTVPVKMNVGWKLSDVDDVARCVQVMPSPDVSDDRAGGARAADPVHPAETMTTSTDPAGGVKLAVVAVVPVSTSTHAGLDPSTVIVPPEAGTSYAHQFSWSAPEAVLPAP